MSADIDKIKKLITDGEGLTVEFKESRNSLNKDAYDTVCAFLNRHGGTILLGVDDNKNIVGVELDFVQTIKEDFVTTVNNPQKINPPTYLSVDQVEIDGKIILYIYVPESSQVHRCGAKIFDRNEDGDLDITNNTDMVSRLYQRKQSSYSENKIFPHTGLEDLELDLLARCRKTATIRRGDHPWKDMDDMALLQSAQLYQTDRETGKSGLTLAGILLLGKQASVLSAVPHHRTDLILRKVNLDRYDDRDLVEVNLVESYDRILAFVAKHLPDPFYLEGTINISLRDTIFREVASNILIHREYMNAFPAKLIIENGLVRTENSNRPHGMGIINPASFTPYPKNPVIARFFRQIGLADELGSGVRNLMKYGKAYGGEDPELVEGDIFKIIIKVPEFGSGKKSGDSAEQGTKSALSRDQVEILHNCLEEKSIGDLMDLVGRTNRTKFRDQVLKPLITAGLIEMTEPDKPTSSKQKYRTTEKGKEFVSNYI